MSAEGSSFGFNSLIPQTYKSKAEAFAKCLQDKLMLLGGISDGGDNVTNGKKRLNSNESEINGTPKKSEDDFDHYDIANNIFVQHPGEKYRGPNIETKYVEVPKSFGKLKFIKDRRGYSSDSEEESDAEDNLKTETFVQDLQKLKADGTENYHNGSETSDLVLNSHKQTELLHKRVHELINDNDKKQETGIRKLQSFSSEESTVDSWCSCDDHDVYDSDDKEEIDYFASQIKGSPKLRSAKLRNRRRGNRNGGVTQEEENWKKYPIVDYSPVSGPDVFSDFDTECFSPVEDPDESDQLLVVNNSEEQERDQSTILLDGLDMENYDVPYRILRESSSANNLEKHFNQSNLDIDPIIIGDSYLRKKELVNLNSSPTLKPPSPDYYSQLLTPPPSPEVPKDENSISSSPSRDYVVNVKESEEGNEVNHELETDHIPEPMCNGFVDEHLENVEEEPTETDEGRCNGFVEDHLENVEEETTRTDEGKCNEIVEEKLVDSEKETSEIVEEVHLEKEPDEVLSKEETPNELEYTSNIEGPTESETEIKTEMNFAKIVVEPHQPTDEIQELPPEPPQPNFCSTFSKKGGMIVECPCDGFKLPTLELNINPEESQTICSVEVHIDEVDSSKTDTKFTVESVDESFLQKPAENGHTNKNDDEDDGDMLSPRLKLRRCSSLKTWKTPPGTPGRKKIVRFADALGLDLADVRTFLDEIPKIPSSAYEDLNFDLNSDPYPSCPCPAPAPTMPTLIPSFSQPGGQIDFLERVRNFNVCLESAVLTDTTVLTISGIIRVRNLDFNKSVHVRYTLDNWLTFSDLQATYVPNSCDGFSDKFSFVLYGHTLKIGQSLEFAIRLECLGNQYWDNNAGKNYVFQCLPQSPSTAIFTPLSTSPESWTNKFY